MNYKGEIIDRPPVDPLQMRTVMEQVGNDVTLAAQALGVAEADVAKSMAHEAISREGPAEAFAGFTPEQQKMAHNQVATLAVLGENDGIKLRAAQFIIERSTVSAESRFKAKHGVGSNTGVQFLIAIQQAKEKVRTLYA